MPRETMFDSEMAAAVEAAVSSLPGPAEQATMARSAGVTPASQRELVFMGRDPSHPPCPHRFVCPSLDKRAAVAIRSVADGSLLEPVAAERPLVLWPHGRWPQKATTAVPAGTNSKPSAAANPARGADTFCSSGRRIS